MGSLCVHVLLLFSDPSVGIASEVKYFDFTNAPQRPNLALDDICFRSQVADSGCVVALRIKDITVENGDRVIIHFFTDDQSAI